MAVKLRLVRMGKKKQPTYRVVAANSRSPRDGRFLEVVGTYAPRGRSSSDRDAVVTIDNERAAHWLRHGAQPTERVEKLLRAAGAFDQLEAGPSGAAGVPEPAPEAGGQDAAAAGVSGVAGMAGVAGATAGDEVTR